MNFKQAKYYMTAILFLCSIFSDINAMEQPNIYTLGEYSYGHPFFEVHIKEDMKPFKLKIFSIVADCKYLEEDCFDIVQSVLDDNSDHFLKLFDSDARNFSTLFAPSASESYILEFRCEYSDIFKIFGTFVGCDFESSIKIPSITSSIFFKQLLMLSSITGRVNCFIKLLSQMPTPDTEEQIFLDKYLGFCACFHGNLKNVVQLSEVGFLDSKYSDYFWYGAIRGGSNDVAVWLLSNGFHTFSEDIILSFIRYSKFPVELITAIFQSNSVDFKNKTYYTSEFGKGRKAIHLATEYSNATMLEYLLKNVGIDVNTLDSIGRNPLFYATEERIAKMLIDAGIDIEAQDNCGLNPFVNAPNTSVANVILDAAAAKRRRQFEEEENCNIS